MVRKISCLAIALAAAGCLGVQDVQAQGVGPVPNGLYHNYYVGPQGPNGVGAELYPCPRPTPQLVGHTYITYQPLAPHEFLYTHHQVYWTAHPDGSSTRTCVCWMHWPVMKECLPSTFFAPAAPICTSLATPYTTCFPGN
ncbi:MAG: hypothetical protein ABSG68_05590 [Thermoguttaceae bacterium]|jgi:hypothetical protein